MRFLGYVSVQAGGDVAEMWSEPMTCRQAWRWVQDARENTRAVGYGVVPERQAERLRKEER